MVLSNQVYAITRSATAPCDIIGVSVRHPYIYNYLKRIASPDIGAKVIIRLYPSPGNFPDWNVLPGVNKKNWVTHTLISEYNTTPTGTNYCLDWWSDPIADDTQYVPMDYFRSVDDLARTMHFIHQLNVSNGWTEFGFIPANEPNKEWYGFESRPEVHRAAAWEDMDSYFVSLYNYVQQEYSAECKVLAPPMVQALYAEIVDIETPDCAIRELVDANGSTVGVGYTHMYETYYDKNDGIVWNNLFHHKRSIYGICVLKGGMYPTIFLVG